MNQLSLLRDTLNKRKGNKEQIEADIVRLSKKIKKDNKHLLNLEEAKSIVEVVGLKTQKQLEFHISDIASLALESIFPNPYKLVLSFETKRGKNECNILFERDGNQIDPLGSSGFGAVDVASFALRIAAWSMDAERTRNSMLLDEPFKHLSDEFQEAASEMVKEVSKRLGIQFIITSHDPVLTTYADRTFKTTINKKGISKVKAL